MLKFWSFEYACFHHFPAFVIESFVKGPQETLVAQYTLEFISFYSGNQGVEREWKDQPASNCRIGENSRGQTAQRSIRELSIQFQREEKINISQPFVCIENPFPFSGWVLLFVPVTSCHCLIIHCTYLARSECAAQIEYHLVLRSETGNRIEIPFSVISRYLPHLTHVLPSVLLPDVPDVEDVDAAVLLHTDSGVCWHHVGPSGQDIIAPPPDN